MESVKEKEVKKEEPMVFDYGHTYDQPMTMNMNDNRGRGRGRGWTGGGQARGRGRGRGQQRWGQYERHDRGNQERVVTRDRSRPPSPERFDTEDIFTNREREEICRNPSPERDVLGHSANNIRNDNTILKSDSGYERINNSEDISRPRDEGHTFRDERPSSRPYYVNQARGRNCFYRGSDRERNRSPESDRYRQYPRDSLSPPRSPGYTDYRRGDYRSRKYSSARESHSRSRSPSNSERRMRGEQRRQTDIRVQSPFSRNERIETSVPVTGTTVEENENVSPPESRNVVHGDIEHDPRLRPESRVYGHYIHKHNKILLGQGRTQTLITDRPPAASGGSATVPGIAHIQNSQSSTKVRVNDLPSLTTPASQASPAVAVTDNNYSSPPSAKSKHPSDAPIIPNRTLVSNNKNSDRPGLSFSVPLPSTPLPISLSLGEDEPMDSPCDLDGRLVTVVDNISTSPSDVSGDDMPRTKIPESVESVKPRTAKHPALPICPVKVIDNSSKSFNVPKKTAKLARKNQTVTETVNEQSKTKCAIQPVSTVQNPGNCIVTLEVPFRLQGATRIIQEPLRQTEAKEKSAEIISSKPLESSKTTQDTANKPQKISSNLTSSNQNTKETSTKVKKDALKRKRSKPRTSDLFGSDNDDMIPATKKSHKRTSDSFPVASPSCNSSVVGVDTNGSAGDNLQTCEVTEDCQNKNQPNPEDSISIETVTEKNEVSTARIRLPIAMRMPFFMSNSSPPLKDRPVSDDSSTLENSTTTMTQSEKAKKSISDTNEDSITSPASVETIHFQPNDGSVPQSIQVDAATNVQIESGEENTTSGRDSSIIAHGAMLDTSTLSSRCDLVDVDLDSFISSSETVTEDFENKTKESSTPTTTSNVTEDKNCQVETDSAHKEQTPCLSLLLHDPCPSGRNDPEMFQNSIPPILPLRETLQETTENVELLDFDKSKTIVISNIRSLSRDAESIILPSSETVATEIQVSESLQLSDIDTNHPTSEADADSLSKLPILEVVMLNDDDVVVSCANNEVIETPVFTLGDDGSEEQPMLRIRSDLFSTVTDDRIQNLVTDIGSTSSAIIKQLRTTLGSLSNALKTNDVQLKLLKFEEFRSDMVNHLAILDTVHVKLEAEDVLKYNIPEKYNFDNVLRIPIEEMADYFLKILIVGRFLRECECTNLETNLMFLHYRLTRVLNFYVNGSNAGETEGNLQNILMAIKPRVYQFQIAFEEITQCWDHIRTFHLRTKVDKKCVLFEQSEVGFKGFARQVDAIVIKIRGNVYKRKNVEAPPQNSAAQNYSFENDMKILFEISGRQFPVSQRPSAQTSTTSYASFGYTVPTPATSAFDPIMNPTMSTPRWRSPGQQSRTSPHTSPSTSVQHVNQNSTHSMPLAQAVAVSPRAAINQQVHLGGPIPVSQRHSPRNRPQQISQQNTPPQLRSVIQTPYAVGYHPSYPSSNGAIRQPTYLPPNYRHPYCTPAPNVTVTTSGSSYSAVSYNTGFGHPQTSGPATPAHTAASMYTVQFPGYCQTSGTATTANVNNTVNSVNPGADTHQSFLSGSTPTANGYQFIPQNSFLPGATSSSSTPISGCNTVQYTGGHLQQPFSTGSTIPTYQQSLAFHQHQITSNGTTPPSPLNHAVNHM